jgi:uncharacterized membrane protein
MYSSQLNYMPLAWPFFSFLVGLFLVLVVLIQVHALRFAYMRLGISSGVALLLLLGSLLGSYINVPIASLVEQQVVSDQEISFFGMRYVVPVVVDWPGTIVAVNVGGAVIPVLLSLYLLAKNNLWARGIVATVCVAAVCYLLAQPVPGVGIAIPTVAPPFVTAVAALLLGGPNVAAVAYVSGSLGTLIGADLLNLGRVQGMGAPVASIGGAGTFDGIFLTGILAVLFASFSFRRTRGKGASG